MRISTANRSRKIIPMPTIEVGRVCVKLNGRETGLKCVIVDVIDKNFVLVTGPQKLSGVRRRRTNVKHLEPTEDTLEIKKGASDEDVAKAIGRGRKADAFKEAVLPKQVLVTA
jgi:large subunit ribosomal protein L14e